MKNKPNKKTTLEKARETSTLGTGNLLSEIVVFLQTQKNPSSPIAVGDALNVRDKKIRHIMQRKLNLADGRKAEQNAGIVQISNALGGGYVRLTKVTPTATDSSRNRYEWKKTIPKSWMA